MTSTAATSSEALRIFHTSEIRHVRYPRRQLLQSLILQMGKRWFHCLEPLRRTSVSCLPMFNSRAFGGRDFSLYQYIEVACLQKTWCYFCYCVQTRVPLRHVTFLSVTVCSSHVLLGHVTFIYNSAFMSQALMPRDFSFFLRVRIACIQCKCSFVLPSTANGSLHMTNRSEWEWKTIWIPKLKEVRAVLYRICSRTA